MKLLSGNPDDFAFIFNFRVQLAKSKDYPPVSLRVEFRPKGPGNSTTMS
jgi:hypothetical protein